MTNQVNKRKLRKLFILFVIVFITAVVLIFETYAWFVGITTVNVDEFQVTVTGAQGLELSLNGQYWTNIAGGSANNKLTLSAQDIMRTSAPSNANHGYNGSGNIWPTNGLKPLSSSGVIDETTGRLKLFEKSSLASTEGGYRLIANQIDNSTTEQDGYIAFDLFIRNGKENLWSTIGENIYLTKNSAASNSTGTNHGVANSVRVGFFKIAAMKSYGASTANIQGLSCKTSGSGYTKYCTANGANKMTNWHIWEPNYNVHTPALVTYFNGVCKKRDSTSGNYTTTACDTISTSATKQTKPILNDIVAGDNVDIYDGINGYTGTVASQWTDTTKKLMAFDTYHTPSSYTASNQILQLAGNSITKVRVYIWLEGQDIDNYDVIAGDTIKINFGFTKDRFGIENT